MVRIPRSLQELHLAARAARDELLQANGTCPTVEQIAERLGTTEEPDFTAMDATETCWPTSLDAPNREGEDSVTERPGVDAGSDSSIDHHLLQESLSRLVPTERLIVKPLFYEGCTQRQVAEELEVSQMQISRLMNKTLKELGVSFGPARGQGPADRPDRPDRAGTAGR